MSALEFLKYWSSNATPLMSNEGRWPLQPASNSELRRWLKKGSVLINGAYPQPEDEVVFPISHLVFNAKSRNCCTMVKE